jgi:LemA protein
MNQDVPGIILILVPIGIVILWLMATYNGLVRLSNQCDESWSGIDTELKRRYDLIPNLVNTVKGYATHERDVLDRVIQARNAAVASTGSPAEQARDENKLVGQMRQMLAVVEHYPDLKASANFLALQQELVDTEDRIQRARRFYNANVRDLNTRIEVFPSNVVAGWFRFAKRDWFEVDDIIQRQAPAATFG